MVSTITARATTSFYLDTRATGWDKPAHVKNRDEQIKRMVEAQQQMLDELCRQNDRLDKERERTERERERTDKLIDKIINQ